MKKKILTGYSDKEDYKKLLKILRNFFYWYVSKKRMEKEDIGFCITIEELPQKGGKR